MLLFVPCRFIPKGDLILRFLGQAVPCWIHPWAPRHQAVLGFLPALQLWGRNDLQSVSKTSKKWEKKRFPIISNELCKESLVTKERDPATFRELLQFLVLSSESHLCFSLHPCFCSRKHSLSALGITRNVQPQPWHCWEVIPALCLSQKAASQG